jgi:riboflavin synthase
MFTGLIQDVGNIRSIEWINNGAKVSIVSTGCLSKSMIGDSISINGICSTITSISEGVFTVDYLEETLKKTTVKHWSEGEKVNLELCMTPESFFGGHMMSGHVDGTGSIIDFKHNEPWHKITILFNKKFAPFIIEKGSIALDGISLTLVDITEETFSCHLIPHTVTHTNLDIKKVGDEINLEFDVIGKYLHRFHTLKENESGEPNDTRAI